MIFVIGRSFFTVKANKPTTMTMTKTTTSLWIKLGSIKSVKLEGRYLPTCLLTTYLLARPRDVTSVTRLGSFERPWVKKFLTKVDQYWVTFWANITFKQELLRLLFGDFFVKIGLFLFYRLVTLDVTHYLLPNKRGVVGVGLEMYFDVVMLFRCLPLPIANQSNAHEYIWGICNVGLYLT